MALFWPIFLFLGMISVKRKKHLGLLAQGIWRPSFVQIHSVVFSVHRYRRTADTTLHNNYIVLLGFSTILNNFLILFIGTVAAIKLFYSTFSHVFSLYFSTFLVLWTSVHRNYMTSCCVLRAPCAVSMNRENC